jgi:hypothetical protein
MSRLAIVVLVLAIPSVSRAQSSTEGGPVDAPVPVDAAPVGGTDDDDTDSVVPADDDDADDPSLIDDDGQKLPAPSPTDITTPPDGATPIPADGSDPSYGKLPPREGDDLVVPRLNGDIPNLDKSDSMLGNFMDTRLSFSLSDDNWLAGPGQTTPSSPRVDFFPRTNNQLFFDNLNRRDSGFETLSHMVLHRRQKGFIPGMDTEAAIVARFIYFADDTTGRRGAVFRDDGSYIRVRYFFSGSTENEKASNIDVVMFPFDTNRMRLGYLYDISWAGHDIFPSPGVAAPGAKMQLNLFDGYAYIGAKTARLLDENINEIESNWGVMSGIGYDFFDMLQFDLGAGAFQRGSNPRVGVEGEPVWGAGASGRVVFHYGEASPSSIDFRLYRADPALADLFRIARKSRPGIAFLAALEVSHLEQGLQDPENPNSTKLAGWGGANLIGGANAVAASMRFSWADFGIGADAVYRDLGFILFNGPGFVPYQDFPADSLVTPEYLFALSTSYFIEALHLTPGFVLGVQLPASFTGLTPGTLGQTNDGIQDLSAAQVVVVRNIGSRDILPCAEYDNGDSPARSCLRAQQVEPIYAARFALKWDVSEIVAIVAETTFFFDNNETDLVDNAGGIITRKRVSNVNFLTVPGTDIGLLPGTTGPHNVRLGGGLFAQARF